LGEGKLKDIAKWTGGPGYLTPMFVKKKHKAALRFKDDEDEEINEIEEVFEELNEVEEVEASADSAVPTEQAQVVIFDCDLSPSQLRNMENITGAQVLDRTGVIIEIFNRHARTRAAKLQVEIARLSYVAPRLRETGGGEDRGGGGIGGKGAGESSIELDRRHIRDRIKELKQELEAIAQEHETRRARRSQELVVALVGYTNAGKSSLMRALTGSEIYVADKLFATLDTTVRILYPETKPKILISDTVGFIKKLPHDLVASFKSTLDEALNASLLLYVVDCSDPTFRSQLEVTKSVLTEVGAGETENVLILNKVDRLSDEERAAIALEFPQGYFLSAHREQDVADLRTYLIKHFENKMVDQDVFIPYDVQGVIGDIRARFAVLGEEYDGRGVTLKVRASADEIQRIKTRYGI
jgi:GTP-binding protein HflX